MNDILPGTMQLLILKGGIFDPTVGYCKGHNKGSNNETLVRCHRYYVPCTSITALLPSLTKVVHLLSEGENSKKGFDASALPPK